MAVKRRKRTVKPKADVMAQSFDEAEPPAPPKKLLRLSRDYRLPPGSRVRH